MILVMGLSVPISYLDSARSEVRSLEYAELGLPAPPCDAEVLYLDPARVGPTVAAKISKLVSSTSPWSKLKLIPCSHADFLQTLRERGFHRAAVQPEKNRTVSSQWRRRKTMAEIRTGLKPTEASLRTLQCRGQFYSAWLRDRIDVSEFGYAERAANRLHVIAVGLGITKSKSPKATIELIKRLFDRAGIEKKDK